MSSERQHIVNLGEQRRFLLRSSDVTEAIPASALAWLPFSAQALGDWDEECDCLQFLLHVFDKEFEFTDSTGKTGRSSYIDYGVYVFGEGIKTGSQHAARFQELATTKQPSRASRLKEIVIPDFTKHDTFGLALKYLTAWDGVLHEILGGAQFFSIAHVLESETDLECSFELAGGLYYKHAVQVLRGFLESVVLPLLFVDNPNDFQKWRDGRFQVPPLRGNRGLLKRLVARGLMSQDLADGVADLYGDFNEYLHGSHERLIHRGSHVGAYRGQVFLEEELERWAKYFARTVEVGIELMAIQANTWARRRLVEGVFCSVCHRSDSLKREELEFVSRRLVKYVCSVCGGTQFRDK